VSNHKAIVASIKVRKHPNADRLQLGTCLGFQVVVGLNVKDGEIGLLFPEGLQLSEEFARANDLVRRKNEDGTYSGGFFEENRRVRAQKFRGEVSDAFWIPLESLSSFGDTSKLREGDLLDEFNGTKICQKYFTRATRSRIQGQPKTNAVAKVFPQHLETEQLRLNLHKIPLGETVYITEKLHGTSGRFGYIPLERPLKWWERLLQKCGIRIDQKEYGYVNGSRRVVLSQTKDFRWQAAKLFEGKLHKNEIVYFEIVGFEGDAHIMPPHDSNKMKDKEILKKYGPKMEYLYGCPRGSFDVYVYRIAVVNEDGVLYDLPWKDVKRRCEEMAVKHVPELLSWYVNDPEDIRELAEKLGEGSSTLDERHIKEGVCVRVDGSRPYILKAKSFCFRVLEGITALDDNYVDTEDIA